MTLIRKVNTALVLNKTTIENNKMCNKFYKNLLLVITSLLINHSVSADTAISLFDSYAGYVNFVGGEATRRTQSNAGNPCAVLAQGTSNSTSISGIPAGSTIKAAHLYWAGSYSTQAGSTQTTPDYSVVFEGSGISAPASRRYTANYSIASFDLDFYSGVVDVTSIVTSRANPNGSYSFSGLSVNTATQHCTTSSVTAGWSLVIIYENTSTEDLRIVNLFEGFEHFRGSSITLSPSNFRIPVSPINGKLSQITWEGDDGNSSTYNGFTEQLTFNGAVLSDGANPAANQFNSISTILSASPSTGGVDINSHGVDFDAFPIGAYLSAGNTSATTTYSSGGDLVLLSSEIISVTNTPVSDLEITKTHIGNFNVGQNGIYTIAVNNNGPIAEPGAIVVTDTLPAGLSYVSGIGTGWSCSAAGQNITCTRSGSLAVGASAANITLTVSIAAAALPSVTNTASVTGTNFDNISGNNSNSDTVTITTAPSISLKKTLQTISDPVNGTTHPKAIPGALSEYTLEIKNNGSGTTDNDSIILSDAIPANTALYVNDISGAGTGPIRFVDGTPASGLSYNYINLASPIDDVSFSNDAGATYTYTPSPDVDGVDSSVTHVKMATQGTLLAVGGSGSPNFKFMFRVKVQ